MLAPAAARVAATQDGTPDNKPGVMNPLQPAGNYVLLDLGHREYALIAHLRLNSILVHKGDRVRAGQELGHCGNSGNSSEPHVHFHLQDTPTLFSGHSLPALFRGYEADGRRVELGSPVQGQFVRQL